MSSAAILYTIVAITGLIGALMSLVLYFLKRAAPKPIKGLGDWALFPILTFIVSGLYGMQSHWHHMVSMALPNQLLVVAMLLLMRGTYHHFNAPINSKLLAAVVFISLPLILWSSGKNEYYIHRLLFMTGFIAAVCVAQIRILVQLRREGFAAKLLLIALCYMVISLSIRFITALIEPPPTGIFVFSPIQAFYLTSNSVGILLVSIAAMLLVSEQLRSEMVKLVRHDVLTGALSRRAVIEYAQDEFARSSRGNSSLALLLIDLDYFKKINDTHGHQVGDTVLVEFVRSVEQVLRRPSVIGRYGGEEFLVILPETTIEQAFQVAQRVQLQLLTHPMPVRITASIGVACSIPSCEDTLVAMIGRADEALYSAKRDGRNRIKLESKHFKNSAVQVQNVSEGVFDASPTFENWSAGAGAGAGGKDD